MQSLPSANRDIIQAGVGRGFHWLGGHYAGKLFSHTDNPYIAYIAVNLCQKSFFKLCDPVPTDKLRCVCRRGGYGAYTMMMLRCHRERRVSL